MEERHIKFEMGEEMGEAFQLYPPFAQEMMNNIPAPECPSDPNAYESSSISSHSTVIINSAQMRKANLQEKRNIAKSRKKPIRKVPFDSGIQDENSLNKKERQIVRNRISAQKSRDRQKGHIQNLEENNKILQEELTRREGEVERMGRELEIYTLALQKVQASCREEFNKVHSEVTRQMFGDNNNIGNEHFPSFQLPIGVQNRGLLGGSMANAIALSFALLTIIAISVLCIHITVGGGVKLQGGSSQPQAFQHTVEEDSHRQLTPTHAQIKMEDIEEENSNNIEQDIPFAQSDPPSTYLKVEDKFEINTPNIQQNTIKQSQQSYITNLYTITCLPIPKNDNSSKMEEVKEKEPMYIFCPYKLDETLSAKNNIDQQINSLY